MTKSLKTEIKVKVSKYTVYHIFQEAELKAIKKEKQLELSVKNIKA